MPKPLRPLTVLQVIPALEVGGAERGTVDIATALVAAGHRALVASSGGRMVLDLEKTGVQHYDRDLRTKDPLKIIANAFWLRRLILEQNVDIIHARSRAPAWSAWLAASLTKTAFVTTFHAAYTGANFFMKHLYNSVMARGQRVIAISEFIARYIRKNYNVDPRRIITIHRGISFAYFNPLAVSESRKSALREELDLKRGVKTIIMPGRLSPVKGQNLVIDALAKIKDIPYTCTFIGPDQGRSTYRHRLKKSAEEYGIADRIRWAEFIDLPAAYVLADLVLSPSQQAEGFGRVPVEAAAMGTPVIATALGATDETVINDESGFLVPPGNVEVLAQAIRRTLSFTKAERTAFAEKAIRHVHAHFNVKQMCAATLKVYEEVADLK
jgi:glycosyltransferase involved in cell wall biosynthesis